MQSSLIIGISIFYLLLLFGLAYLADQQGRRGRSWVNNPYVYSLSLAVYCTAWTYFGSVGRAATEGMGFLPIYLGPTIFAPIWLVVLRKIILISKSLRLTSISDFISSRYGKSTWLGALATLIAVLGIIPYISIQLKAIASGFEVLHHFPREDPMAYQPFYLDTSLYITGILALFAILFGTRHLDPNERHEGLVAAIAFESVLKLVAFLCVGVFVVYGLFDGFHDLFSQGFSRPEIARLYTFDAVDINAWEWFWLSLLSMFAIVLLPRQFHVAVVENIQPGHVAQASWLFPLYLLLINLFVLPIAVGGLLLFGAGQVQPDDFVLALPLAEGYHGLALFVAIGGFSAATGMVIVATLALSIMISNNLVLPFVLNTQEAVYSESGDNSLPQRLLAIRRVSIVAVLLLAYAYFKSVGSGYTLVSIGLISFTAVAQFAPTVLAGIYWKRASKLGAFAGLSVGFAVWTYTLPLPNLAETGLAPTGFVEHGLLGISWLRPYALFGMEGASHISHAAFWSLTLNTLALVTVSLFSRQSALEITQADYFVDIYKYRAGGADYEVIRRQARVADVQLLLTRFLGPQRTGLLLQRFAQRHQLDLSKERIAGAELVTYAETHLAGAVGAASAKVIISSIVKEDPISLEEMFKILEQTQEIFQYSRAMERKSAELEQMTQQLRLANESLQELDRLKADFITTVTHELRTPITSIKALAKILHDNPDLDRQRTEEFLGIMVSESERITRLINQVLDLEKIHALDDAWEMVILNWSELAARAAQSLAAMMQEQGIKLETSWPADPIYVEGYADRLVQVAVNLLSNAIKFCPPEHGRITLTVHASAGQAILRVTDNGPGIPPHQRALIFEKFTQLSDRARGKPQGSGLGLYLAKVIVERHRGHLSVADAPQGGAAFEVRLPLATT